MDVIKANIYDCKNILRSVEVAQWLMRLMYKPQDLNWMPTTHVRFGCGSACVLQSSTWDQAEVFILLKAFLNKSLPEESLCQVWLLEDTLEETY